LVITPHGVPGPELDSDTAAAFRRIQPAAHPFRRNIKSPAQLSKTDRRLRDLSAVEPIHHHDQEAPVRG